MTVQHIKSWEQFHQAVAAIQQCPILGLDLETTGLDPRLCHIRLLTVSDGNRVWMIDTRDFSLLPIFETLRHKPLVIHNALFDLQFLAILGFWPGQVFDTMLMSQVIYAGWRDENNAPAKHNLQAVAQRELGLDISKELQKSDWSGTLTAEQLHYAAGDARILVPIWESLHAKVGHFKLETVINIEHRCLPAVLWMSVMGVPLNIERWIDTAHREMARADDLRDELNGLIWDILEPGEVVNWNSPVQVKKVFAALGYTLESTGFEVLSYVDDPVAAKLTEYRTAIKRVGTYGYNWKTFYHNGRVYPSWRQIEAVSGRMSSTDPAMQTIPHLEGEPYRSCIEAPPGYALVIADYSQIELRIAAKIANEDKMRAAYNQRADLHTLTAQQVLGVTEVTKADRLAKAVNFGLLYGMGAPKFRRYARLQYGVEMTEAQATEYVAAFFRAYPGLKRWHRSQSNEPATIRTLAGRWRIGIEMYSEKLNSPVQGTGADGLKLALALLWERRGQCPTAYPILCCHDEIVIAVPEDDAEQAKEWLVQCMLDGMIWLLHPLPVEVEAKVGKSWGSK